VNYPIVLKRIEGEVRIRLAVTVFSFFVCGLQLVKPSWFKAIGAYNLLVVFQWYFWLCVGVIGTFFLIRKPSVPGPLYIRRNGLEYRSGGTEFHIGFDEIKGFEVFSLGKESELVLVSVREPEVIVAQQKRRASRIYLRVLQLLYETPVVLQGNYFEIGCQKLKAELELHWELATRSGAERKV
jgi:hypothetical protein